MELVVCILSVVAAVAAAPSLSQGKLPQESVADQQQFFREKRSSYGHQIYAAPPCGSSYIAPVHHAAYSPHYSHYGYGIPAIPSYQHYRGAEDEETMSFSDTEQVPEFMDPMMQEHVPFARYAYGAPAVPIAPHYGSGLQGVGSPSAAIGSLGSAAAGPAIGVFPNANAGGCSVPLLLSCSPSIRPGHIVKSQPYSGNSYRGVDEAHIAHEIHEEPHEQMTHDSAPHLPLHQ